MAGLLEKLEKRIEDRVKQQIGTLEPKLDEMVKILRMIEANTRREK